MDAHEEHHIDFVRETMCGLSKNSRREAEGLHGLQSLNMFSNCQQQFICRLPENLL